MATHPSILAWRIPRTEEPSGPQFIVSQSQKRLKGLCMYARITREQPDGKRYGDRKTRYEEKSQT